MRYILFNRLWRKRRFVVTLLRNIPELDSIDIESIEIDLRFEPDDGIWFTPHYDMYSFIELKYVKPLQKAISDEHKNGKYRFNFMNYFWEIYHEIPSFLFDYNERDLYDQWQQNGIFSNKILQILDIHRLFEVGLSLIKMYYKIIGANEWSLTEILSDEIMPSHFDNIDTFDTKIHSPQLYEGRIEYLCQLLDLVIPSGHSLSLRLKKLLRYHERLREFIE